MVISGKLIHLIQQKNGVFRADVSQALDNAARHCADIGAAVPPDFRLIAYASQRCPHELPAGGLRHRTGQGGLADAGRPHQAKNRCPLIFCQLLYCQIIQDTILDLRQPIMITVQDFLGLGYVHPILGFLAPGQVEQPIQICANNTCLGIHVAHAFQAL